MRAVREKRRTAGFSAVEALSILVITVVVILLAVPVIKDGLNAAYHSGAKERAVAFRRQVQVCLVDVLTLPPRSDAEYVSQVAPNTGMYYSAITNTKEKPKTARELLLYNAVDAGGFSDPFEGMILINYKDSCIELIRYRDITSEIIFEWSKKTDTWKEWKNEPEKENWTSPFLNAQGVTGAVDWNGYKE